MTALVDGGPARGMPDYQDLVNAGLALVDDIAARAADCEAARRVPEETVAAFKATGLHRAIQPARYGGYEMGFKALLDTSFAFGQVCASTAWVCGLYIAHNWALGLFPIETQDDVWGEDPDAVISGSYAPVGRAAPVAGGYRLSGEFPFASGSPGSDWNLCGAMLPMGPDGAMVPCFTLVPKSDYTINWDSWDTVGLGGTGSYVVSVDDAFVPVHRVLTFPDMVGSTGPGAEVNENPLYRLSLLTCVPYTLAMPSVAAATGALELFIEENRMRDTHGAVVLGGSKVAEFQTVQKRVGEAAARLDAAKLVAYRDIEEAEVEVRADGKTSLDMRLRNRRTQSLMAHEAQTAMNLIFDAAGGRCIQNDHPIQRAWRDVAAVNHHISLNFDAVMSMYGQHRFGLPLVGQY
jgi:alkylation response protein AidB-like acyl-CoA dehydrogenase